MFLELYNGVDTLRNQPQNIKNCLTIDGGISARAESYVAFTMHYTNNKYSKVGLN